MWYVEWLSRVLDILVGWDDIIQVVLFIFFLIDRQPPGSTPLYSSAASDVYKRQQLIPGNVLAIFKRGITAVDSINLDGTNQSVTLPDERAGLLMIFQTFEKMSLALVLKADRGIKVGDFVRMP